MSSGKWLFFQHLLFSCIPRRKWVTQKLDLNAWAVWTSVVLLSSSAQGDKVRAKGRSSAARICVSCIRQRDIQIMCSGLNTFSNAVTGKAVTNKHSTWTEVVATKHSKYFSTLQRTACQCGPTKTPSSTYQQNIPLRQFRSQSLTPAYLWEFKIEKARVCFFLQSYHWFKI